MGSREVNLSLTAIEQSRTRRNKRLAIRGVPRERLQSERSSLLISTFRISGPSDDSQFVVAVELQPKPMPNRDLSGDESSPARVWQHERKRLDIHRVGAAGPAR